MTRSVPPFPAATRLTVTAAEPCPRTTGCDIARVWEDTTNAVGAGPLDDIAELVKPFGGFDPKLLSPNWLGCPTATVLEVIDAAFGVGCSVGTSKDAADVSYTGENTIVDISKVEVASVDVFVIRIGDEVPEPESNDVQIGVSLTEVAVVAAPAGGTPIVVNERELDSPATSLRMRAMHKSVRCTVVDNMTCRIGKAVLRLLSDGYRSYRREERDYADISKLT